MYVCVCARAYVKWGFLGIRRFIYPSCLEVEPSISASVSCLPFIVLYIALLYIFLLLPFLLFPFRVQFQISIGYLIYTNLFKYPHHINRLCFTLTITYCFKFIFVAIVSLLLSRSYQHYVVIFSFRRSPFLTLLTCFHTLYQLPIAKNHTVQFPSRVSDTLLFCNFFYSTLYIIQNMTKSFNLLNIVNVL